MEGDEEPAGEPSVFQDTEDTTGIVWESFLSLANEARGSFASLLVPLSSPLFYTLLPKELYVPSEAPRIKGPPSPLMFYREHVAPNVPLIIEGTLIRPKTNKMERNH